MDGNLSVSAAENAAETAAEPAGDSEARLSSIGRVVCVTGSQIIALLDPRVPVVLDPESAEGPEISVHKGAMVKMETTKTMVFGMINGLSVPAPSNSPDDSEIAILEIEAVGEILHSRADDPEGETFQRGVSVFPALGGNVYLADGDDLAMVYRRDDPSAVAIGRIHQNPDLPASIMPDDLLGRHFAILGTTGSGKSCAVTLVLKALLQNHDHAHIVVIDPHGEYAKPFADQAELLDPSTLELPYWMLSFEEMEEIVLGAGQDTQNRQTTANILRESILATKKKARRQDDDLTLSADTPIPYSLSELVTQIDDAAGKLDKAEKAGPYIRLTSRLKSLREDPRFGFIFGGIAVTDSMAKILSRIFRVPVDGKPITIIDVSTVPSEILNVVLSLLGRLTFDFALWSDRAVPVLLICEEAHRYAPRDSTLGFEPAKRALSRIAKEGRKYGVSLGVISQRPSELSIDVLSQCNTIFAMRLGNQRDQEFVRGVMSDAALGLLDFLPSLRNGEAIAVGEGVAVPMRVVFDRLDEDECPRGATALFSNAWCGDQGQDGNFMNEVVARWRQQRR